MVSPNYFAADQRLLHFLEVAEDEPQLEDEDALRSADEQQVQLVAIGQTVHFLVIGVYPEDGLLVGRKPHLEEQFCLAFFLSFRLDEVRQVHTV